MLTLFALSAVARAQMQPLESIQAAAEKEVRSLLPQGKAKYHVSAARLDPRLRLAQCAAAPEAFMPNNATPAAKVTVGVRCATPQWTIYVPVATEVEAQVLVLQRALARQSAVEAGDVELQTRRLPGIASGFISDVADLRGRHLKRAVAAGTPLTADVLVADVLVRRGQQVTLLAANGPFEIRAQGQALSDGGASQRVRVQNVTSGKIVEGVVENASIVRVGL
jgi:flagella basal body P-ring formation protein FlgA